MSGSIASSARSSTGATSPFELTVGERYIAERFLAARRTVAGRRFMSWQYVDEGP